MIVYGAGGHARVVIDAALSARAVVEFILDDDPTIAELSGIGVLSAQDGRVRLAQRQFIVGIGDNSARKRVLERLLREGAIPVSVIHSCAIISVNAEIGSGTVVCAGGVINPGSRIGQNCIINTGATVDHDCTTEPHVHICPGVCLAGNVTIGEGAMVGIGSAVIAGVSIGEWSIVGAGSVVVRDIPPRVVAFGNPARVVRRLDSAPSDRKGEDRA